MAKINRSWNIISEEKKQDAIKEIINFFRNERNEEIGIIAAENLLEHFLKNIGADIYNKGVEDSKNLLKSRLEDIEMDIESLLRK